MGTSLITDKVYIKDIEELKEAKRELKEATDRIKELEAMYLRDEYQTDVTDKYQRIKKGKGQLSKFRKIK